MRVVPSNDSLIIQQGSRNKITTSSSSKPIKTDVCKENRDIGFNNLFSTGRGCCLDGLCSIKSFISFFLIGSLLMTCMVIWAILMVLISQQIEITMGIASLVVWCTCVVSVIIFGLLTSIAAYYLIRKPIKELTRQLFTMKALRFDSVSGLSSILYEFIPLFRIFSEMNNLMKDIRPFIPESITRASDYETDSNNNEVQEKEIQMMVMRNSLKASGSLAQLAKAPSTAIINHSLKSGNSVAKLKRAMSKMRKSMEGNGMGSDGGASFQLRDAGATTSSFTPQVTTNLGLGLSSHITTIIIIQFRNFDGKSYPNTSDLVSVFTLLFQKVQSASRQYKGRCSIITPKVLMISFEVGKNVERNALLCALQLEKQMQAINSQLCEQVNLPPIQFGIGISRSECLIGNIGTAAVRFSALIGACSSNALRLSCLCAYLGTCILTDESLALALQRGFLTRAVHFIRKNSLLDGEILSLDENEIDNKQVIYQLLGESKLQDDEWLYELQQQENNNKYKEFDRAFDLLRVGNVNAKLLSEICDVFGSYLGKYPEDKVVSLLYTQLTELSKLDAKDVEKAIRSFSLEKTSVPLHTDPSFIL